MAKTKDPFAQKPAAQAAAPAPAPQATGADLQAAATDTAAAPAPPPKNAAPALAPPPLNFVRMLAPEGVTTDSFEREATGGYLVPLARLEDAMVHGLWVDHG